MSETLEERVLRHEGLRSLPYRDTLGNYTIGVGHLITEDQAQELASGIDHAKIMEWLEQDLDNASAQLVHYLPWVVHLSKIRQEIFIEMIFQLGITGFLGFHSMLSCAKEGDIDGVVSSMKHSLWHTQTPNRCEELANLYLNNGAKNEH